MQAKVNGVLIDEETLDIARQVMADMEDFDDEDISDENLFEMLIDKELARQYGLATYPEIPQMMLELELSRIIKEEGGEKNFKNILNEMGMSKDEFKNMLQDQARMAAVLEEIHESIPEPDEAVLRTFYDEHSELFGQNETAVVSEIIFFVDNILERHEAVEKANEVVEKLKAGESFFDLRIEYSDDCQDEEFEDEDDPIQSYERGDMPEKLEKAIFAMEIGSVSNIIHDEDAVSIVKLLERLPAKSPSFEEAREEVEEEWLSYMEGKAMFEHAAKLREAAVIEYL